MTLCTTSPPSSLTKCRTRQGVRPMYAEGASTRSSTRHVHCNNVVGTRGAREQLFLLEVLFWLAWDLVPASGPSLYSSSRLRTRPTSAGSCCSRTKAHRFCKTPRACGLFCSSRHSTSRRCSRTTRLSSSRSLRTCLRSYLRRGSSLCA
ncbi:hypothetical protein EXIGLDRAFT_364445 [Exidia glandulosa HHB12029]|uniref:Uncharacterized protein n=1 Tax=Exidia glandulosa HHB12029 TaxID=1314781 RepID=A0A165C4A9_EXIGL|nr:hypothetical protein EXIGLDRAFT_364445 [Exidia glandulosa HHB12029]